LSQKDSLNPFAPSPHAFLLILLILILLHLFTATSISGQQFSTSSSIFESKNQTSQNNKPIQFRTQVNQVVVYASIYDKENQLVSDLSRDDFIVSEDNVEQELSYFGQDDVPSTLGMVIDSSGSMRNKYELVNKASLLFLTMNNPLNEFFLVSFKNEVTLENNFTRDVEDIKYSLSNIIISGGTALYDAIYLAVNRASEGAELKKTIIVFTDGEDRDSFYTYEELLGKIRESDVQIYMVAFLDFDLSNQGGFFGIFKSDQEKVKDKINTISEYTGGKAFFPEQINQLNRIFQSIAHEIRHQYRLAYISNNTTPNNKWRKINVILKNTQGKGVKVRARKGYYPNKGKATTTQ